MYSQFMMHGQKNIKLRVCKVVDLLNLSKWQIILNTEFYSKQRIPFIAE